MNKNVHGLEVLHFMLAHEQGFSMESLKQAIAAQFGPDTRFDTCKAEGLTAEQLIAFLAENNLFVETGSGFNVQAEMLCQLPLQCEQPAKP